MPEVLKLKDLFGFLFPCDVDGDEAGAEEGAAEDLPEDADAESDEDSGDAADDSQDETPDEEGSEGEEEPPKRVSRAQREILKQKERTKALEEEVQRLRQAIPQPPAAPDHEAQLRAAEDAKLRDPATTEMERWQINSNRTLRESHRAAVEAQRRAEDLADRTEFRTLIASNPRAAKIAPQVEKELASLRAKGGNAPRESIAAFLLGKALLEGRIKSKDPAPKTGKLPDAARGRTPGARTDVSAKTGRTEREKRYARLENLQI